MSIILENLTKRYGNQFVVDDVSLEVADGELFVLLGSSGSGKSTILRMIAGLSTPSSGRILLHERDVTALTPQERGTGFVFQNYSIFRHMSVSENIEFGLKIRKVSRQERTQKREQLLDLVGLTGLGKRFAHQLSGGQQQRVALARALVYEPNVLLLDEPFGALDVKIRAQLRRSLKEIQRRLGVTTILVTHDQEEAFELADRIGVLERGRLLEVGAGEALYTEPKSLFAATFLGAGAVLVGRASDGQAKFGSLALPIPPDVAHEEDARVQLLFRPEQVSLSAEKPSPGLPLLGKGAIIEKNFTGALRRVRLKLPRLERTRQLAPIVPFGEENFLIDAVVPTETILDNNDLWVALRDWTILQPPSSRLLVCDIGDEQNAPLAITEMLAERLRASTTVLAIADNPEAGEKLRATFNTRMQEARLPHGELHIRYGNPVEQIAIEKAESLYEMMVLADTSRGRISRLPNPYAKARNLSKTLVTLLERADIPVLVVKAERNSIKRLLICTAAGEPGKSDVKVGGRLARRLGANVTLLYVARESQAPSALTKEHLQQAVITLRVLDIEGEVKIRQAATPVEGILAEAESGDYDLIVLGSHGPRSNSLFRVNDVTLEVLSATDRPVLIVPAEDI
jgi:ABC-type Fe3+/spermidine/putrescine transport system ATPase subunit/nucleotide-binding universal stress UspA family protein